MPPIRKEIDRTGYWIWDITERYETNPGKRMLPVGRIGADAQAVDLHSQITCRVVRFHLARQDREPAIPDPTPKEGETLIHAGVSPTTPLLGVEGHAVWEIKGVYVFGLKKSIPPAQFPRVPVANV